MTISTKVIACVLVWAIAGVTAGCHSMKTVSPAQPRAPAFGKVKAGDTVRVQTHDGRRAQFIVQRVDPDALVAPDGTRFARTEISRLQRRTFSLWKTAALAGAAFFAFAYLQFATEDSLFEGEWQ